MSNFTLPKSIFLNFQVFTLFLMIRRSKRPLQSSFPEEDGSNQQEALIQTENDYQRAQEHSNHIGALEQADIGNQSARSIDDNIE